MKSFALLIVFCLTLAISTSYSTIRKGKCPSPKSPYDDFNFYEVQRKWYEVAHTDRASREKVICVEQQFYPETNGNVQILVKGGVTNENLWAFNFTKGSYSSANKTYYINAESDDGFITQFWFPYAAYQYAVFYACTQLTPTVFTDRGWVLSRTTASDPYSVNFLETFTGRKALPTVQDSLVCAYYRG